MLEELVILILRWQVQNFCEKQNLWGLGYEVVVHELVR